MDREGPSDTRATAPQREGSELSILRRLAGEAVLACHLTLSAATVWLAPRGFPVTHPRFWLLGVLPILVLALSLASLWSLFRGKRGWSGPTLLALAAAWAGLSGGARWLFPISTADLWAFGMLAAGAVAVAAACLVEWRRRSVFPLLAGLAVGIGSAAALRAPAPTTLPLLAKAPVPDATWAASPDGNGSGLIRLASGEIKIEYAPLLSFGRVSPDRFWSLLAPPGKRRGLGETKNNQSVFPDGTTLATRRSDEDKRVEVLASTPVEAATYTHLNTYARATVTTLRKPTIRFSPCPEARIEVKQADYPTGAPARFACLDANGSFQVLEAATGEKGPYTVLARGPLARGEPLTVWIGEADRDVAFLRLDDWSAQASTGLSPTAGWGIPQNAIEFQWYGSAIELWVALASTSVGRGWDTVGHAPGVYRNRSTIALVPDPPNGEAKAERPTP